jgi:hypothetical protein
MLTQTRETVINAVLALLQGVTFSTSVRGHTSFVTVSRRLVHWSGVSKYQRPAAFLTVHTETPIYRNEQVPAYQKISMRVFIYIDASDDTSIPDVDVDTILDGIDSALQPIGGQPKQTLGGIVSHCRIEGDIIRDPGDMDGDGIIIVPLAVTLT